MQLADYPTAIREAALNLNRVNEQIAGLRQQAQTHEAEADFETAFNAELRNDNQRRSHRDDLLRNNAAYQSTIADLSRLNTDRAYIETELERLRNALSVARLERRMAIAQMLVGVEAREVIGL